MHRLGLPDQRTSGRASRASLRGSRCRRASQGEVAPERAGPREGHRPRDVGRTYTYGSAASGRTRGSRAAAQGEEEKVMRLIRALLLGLGGAARPRGRAGGLFAIAGSRSFTTPTTRDIDEFAGFDLGTGYRFTRFGGADRGRAAVRLSDGRAGRLREGRRHLDGHRPGRAERHRRGPRRHVPVASRRDGNDALFGGGGARHFPRRAGRRQRRLPRRPGRAGRLRRRARHRGQDDNDTRLVRGDRGRRRRRRRPPPDRLRRHQRRHPPGRDRHPRRPDRPGLLGRRRHRPGLDGDGIPRPQDCDDSNARIKPGAREVVGNDVDENCDTGRAVPGLGGSCARAGRPTATGRATSACRLATCPVARRSA